MMISFDINTFFSLDLNPFEICLFSVLSPKVSDDPSWNAVYVKLRGATEAGASLGKHIDIFVIWCTESGL